MVQGFYVKFKPRFSFILAHYLAIRKEMVNLAHRLGEQFNTKQRWWDKDKSKKLVSDQIPLFSCNSSKMISTYCEFGIKLKIFHKMVDGSLQLFLHTASKGFQRIRQFSKRGKMILVCHIRGDLTK